MLSFERTFAGRTILVTGHTGFTGSWACLWLTSLGARVCGFALAPDTRPSLYEELGLEGQVDSTIGDLANRELLARTFERVQPDAVLHLAAQPLVRRSYREPLSTFATNAMGTAHVLEAARQTGSVKAIVCITTDKVYRNNEWPWPYRENDSLGGKDPYSASKAAAEMIVASYAASFGSSDGTGVAMATARGGNIIGGGDWSEDRLIPDYVRAVVDRKRLVLRYPQATRPWQHVLALVQGYLQLLSGLIEDPARHLGAWNFGPAESRDYSVREVVNLLEKNWSAADIEFMDTPLHEAVALAVDSSLARNRLGWRPPWNTPRVVAETADWYRGFYEGTRSARELCMMQIEAWRAGLEGTD